MEEPLLVLEPNTLTAIDPTTGAVRWSTSLPGCNPIYARLAIAEGVAVVAAYDFLACVQQQSGQLLWRVPTRKGARGGVVIRNGRLFLYKSGAIECYDGRGARLWAREGESQYGGSLGFSGDVCWVPNDRN
ncbi:PQQ-binding-like beta-propeller repeat protein [Polyangium spumosum]|uniref:PQQ-binding-like beta-propeller repeat protein n=1 Tax=Polyangium spumosum TaxID=889282 RepID=A0A6N7PV30_9BACT|nr:PQQ-binding-like beta-propeller repeat protein [Polyangium spumosum]MRG94290.1 PQQ-binding-like beta-propeller repeat protein [Polyangium spumosum]